MARAGIDDFGRVSMRVEALVGLRGGGEFVT